MVKMLMAGSVQIYGGYVSTCHCCQLMKAEHPNVSETGFKAPVLVPRMFHLPDLACQPTCSPAVAKNTPRGSSKISMIDKTISYRTADSNATEPDTLETSHDTLQQAEARCVCCRSSRTQQSFFFPDNHPISSSFTLLLFAAAPYLLMSSLAITSPTKQGLTSSAPTPNARLFQQ